MPVHIPVGGQATDTIYFLNQPPQHASVSFPNAADATLPSPVTWTAAAPVTPIPAGAPAGTVAAYSTTATGKTAGTANIVWTGVTAEGNSFTFTSPNQLVVDPPPDTAVGSDSLVAS